MSLLEHAGLLEEGFRRHGEELGGIGGAIGIQRRVATEDAVLLSRSYSSPRIRVQASYWLASLQDRECHRRPHLPCPGGGRTRAARGSCRSCGRGPSPGHHPRRRSPRRPSRLRRAGPPRLPARPRLRSVRPSWRRRPRDRPGSTSRRGKMSVSLWSKRTQAWAAIVTLISSVSSRPPQPSKFFSARKTWTSPWSSRRSASGR